MAEGWLTGWKSISAYVGLHVHTCKKYKKRYSFPVKYLPGGTPVCLPYELDQWIVAFNKSKYGKRLSQNKK